MRQVQNPHLFYMNAKSEILTCHFAILENSKIIGYYGGYTDCDPEFPEIRYGAWMNSYDEKGEFIASIARIDSVHLLYLDLLEDKNLKFVPESEWAEIKKKVEK